MEQPNGAGLPQCGANLCTKAASPCLTRYTTQASDLPNSPSFVTQAGIARIDVDIFPVLNFEKLILQLEASNMDIP